MSKKERVGIIGGGPAGMMAAITAGKNPKNQVVLLEKNEKLGKKLYITGKGRCNITNSIDISEFFNYIPRNKEFLYSSLYSFTNDDIIKMLDELGLKTVVERGNRVFPESNKSNDVLKAFEKALRLNNVEIHLNNEVSAIEKSQDVFTVKSIRGNLEFDKLIIATGGISYPMTGSTGDGYKFSKKFGHTVVDPEPSLVPVVLKDKYLSELQGLSIKNAEISVYVNKKLKHSEFGEFLFAHFGITGPIVLTLSEYLSNYKKNEIEIKCDFKPALDTKKLDTRLQREFAENSNKQILTVMYNLLPRSLAKVVLEISEVDLETPCHQITKAERQKINDNIKGFPMTYDSLADIKLAIITKGGVNVKEINPSTMESKIIPNLYFCGELIDINAFTGGFNLQLAYSTGFLAGISV